MAEQGIQAPFLTFLHYRSIAVSGAPINAIACLCRPEDRSTCGSVNLRAGMCRSLLKLSAPFPHQSICNAVAMAGQSMVHEYC